MRIILINASVFGSVFGWSQKEELTLVGRAAQPMAVTGSPAVAVWQEFLWCTSS